MDEKERIKKANKTYCDEHAGKGIKICCWEKMPGYQSFVNGEITEAELCEQANDEIGQIEATFGKYLYDDKKDGPVAPIQGPLEDKAKTANKIYRQACVDSGHSFCFFKNFVAWQQFVHGEIGETEFYEKARTEIINSKAGLTSEN